MKQDINKAEWITGLATVIFGIAIIVLAFMLNLKNISAGLFGFGCLMFFAGLLLPFFANADRNLH